MYIYNSELYLILNLKIIKFLFLITLQVAIVLNALLYLVINICI